MENKTNPTGKQQPEKKKGDASKGIMIGIIVLLAGAAGYLGFNGQKQAEVITVQTQKHEADSTEIAKKISDLDELQKRFEAMKAENEALGLSVDSLQTKILELEGLKDQLRSKNITIANLNAKFSKVQGSYISMKSTYDSLLLNNKYLSGLRDSLLTITSAQKDSLSNLSVKNEEYAKKVALASILRAENYKLVVISAKGKEEKPNDIYKAKSVGKLKLNFNLGDNPVATQDDKDIYFRLIEPSGSTIFEGEKTFTVDGKESFYTDKQTVRFTNSKQTVTFIYNKGSAYKPGKYTIELFSEGHKIGDTYLTLK